MHGKDRENLESSLNAYTASAEPVTAADSWRQRLGNWPIYAAATGSALALGTSAAASIIYSGIQNFNVSVTVANPGYRTNYQSFSVGGGLAFPSLFAFHVNSAPALRVGGVAISASCGCSTQFFGLPFSGLASNYPIKRLSFGQMISDGLATGPGSTQLNSQGFLAFQCQGSDLSPCIGGSDIDLQPWGASNATGFAGFKTGGGNFGWVRLYWQSSDGFANSITAVDWAIQDNGTPILAGQTADAVPEPGTMSMALLAAGSAGILAWQKRRKAAAQAGR